MKKLDFPIMKFIKDCHNFAEKHPSITQNEINRFLADYTVRYANSIEGLVVQDNDYLEEIFSLVQDLWKVIIIQSRPSKGKVTISPFKLLWARKDLIKNAYGNENTHEFFVQVLEEEMIKKIDEENAIVEEIEDLPEFDRKGKVTLEQIKPEIKDIVHKEFDYEVYSQLDNSNTRFLRKQENMSKLDNIHDAVRNNEKEVKNKKKIEKEDYNLFSDEQMMENNENLPI